MNAPRKSAADNLVDLALADAALFCTPTDEPHALRREGPQIPESLRGSGSYRARLASTYQRTTGKVASQSALADALQVLEGRALEAEPRHLALRVGQHDDAFVLDLGDNTGRAVVLCPGKGWEVVDASPVLFRRTPLTAPLPEPTRDGDLCEGFDLLNVAEQDQPLVVGWWLSLLIPDIAHPAVILQAEQGSGKSTASRILASVLDPSTVPLRRPPTDIDSWTTAATGSWVVALDNLSSLQPWLSDAFCRAVTGDGDVRRQLYTNGDLHVVSMRRCLVVNGIDVTGIRDDLADRALPLRLDPLRGKYRDEAKLARRWEVAHPRILGALLNLAVPVLAMRQAVVLPDAPRMVDFARILAALDAVLGTSALPRYRELGSGFAADAVDGDPVLEAITAAVREPYTGTAGYLLDLITGEYHLKNLRPPKDWPATARDMTALLRRRSPSLRRLGWEVDDLGRGGKDKAVRWRLVPPSNGGQLAGDEFAMPASGGRSAGVIESDARHWEAS